MMLRKPSRILVALGIVLAVCIAAFSASILSNQLNASWDSLNETDRAVLEEYNTLATSIADDDIWEGFHLDEKPVLAMPGDWGIGYLINPTEPVSSIFAKKIDVPAGWSISVYRIAAASPEMMQFRLDGDFNTLETTYTLMGNDVYYVKYGAHSVEEPWSSEHFAPFIAHEAFHYYVQAAWPDGGRFPSDGATEEDLELLEEEYQALARMQEQLISGDPDRAVLKTSAREYVEVMRRRLAANEEYVRAELEMETVEGSATYVGIQAARRVGYDFGVMYFTNKKDVSFSEVMPQYRAGNLDEGFLADRMPYETGSILCLVMDELGIADWQERLSAQTVDNPLTLYDVMRGWAETTVT